MKEPITLGANNQKQRLLAPNDTIFIQKNPTIAFVFRSFHTSINELPPELNRLYHIGKELGSGACGIVYFTQNRRTCQIYALKYMTINARDVANTPVREIELLRQLSHPCIVRMHDKRTYSGAVAIFLDFMAGGDLLERIRSNHHLSESTTKCLFYQICCGVHYLHNQRITHRDLKPENILLATSEEETLVRISDFGLSRRVRSSSQMASHVGTEIYLAPEVSKSGNYTNKVDIWSLGVVLFNCLCGQYPFKADTANKVARFQQDVWHDVSDDAKNLIRQALLIDVNARLSMDGMLANQWLDTNDPDVMRACDIIDRADTFTSDV